MKLMKQLSNNMKKSFISVLTLMIFAITILSCSSSEYKYPPVSATPTKTYNYGHVVWRDLVTPDPKKAAEFYKKVFGWQVQDLSKDDVKYWIFKNNGKPVAGMYMMPKKKSDASGEWVCTISVPSVDNSASYTKSSGGSILIEPFEMNGRGKVTLLADPQKAPFALIHSSTGDPVLSEPLENEFLWSENWANNPEESVNFYKTLLNAQTEEIKDDNRDYTILENGGKKAEGIVKNPVENVRSHWMQYIRVSDVNLITQKAKDAGAEIILSPDSNIREGNVAIMLDPTGAVFSVQKWTAK